MEAGYSAFKDNLVKVNDLNAIEGSEGESKGRVRDMMCRVLGMMCRVRRVMCRVLGVRGMKRGLCSEGWD